MLSVFPDIFQRIAIQKPKNQRFVCQANFKEPNQNNNKEILAECKIIKQLCAQDDLPAEIEKEIRENLWEIVLEPLSELPNNKPNKINEALMEIYSMFLSLFATKENWKKSVMYSIEKLDETIGYSYLDYYILSKVILFV